MQIAATGVIIRQWNTRYQRFGDRGETQYYDPAPPWIERHSAPACDVDGAEVTHAPSTSRAVRPRDLRAEETRHYRKLRVSWRMKLPSDGARNGQLYGAEPLVRRFRRCRGSSSVLSFGRRKG